MKFRKFFLQRVLAWALTIWIGVTFIFFIPRMFPSDPGESCVCSSVWKDRCWNNTVLFSGMGCFILTLVPP